MNKILFSINRTARVSSLFSSVNNDNDTEHRVFLVVCRTREREKLNPNKCRQRSRKSFMETLLPGNDIKSQMRRETIFLSSNFDSFTMRFRKFPRWKSHKNHFRFQRTGWIFLFFCARSLATLFCLSFVIHGAYSGEMSKITYQY